jgi:hypothetical protein
MVLPTPRCEGVVVSFESGGPDRLVVHMTLTGGEVTEVTHRMTWSEVRELLRALQEFFDDDGARTDGWIVDALQGGFVASKASTSITFAVTAVAENPLTSASGPEQTTAPARPISQV